MTPEYGDAAQIVGFMEGTLACRLLCPNRAQDEVAADIARREGNSAAADEITRQMKEREARCLGGVPFLGEVACGVEHGNVTETEGTI